MNEEPDCLICKRATRAPGIPGSTLTNCTECDAAVWVSPASFPLIAQHNLIVLCMVCAAVKPPPEELFASQPRTDRRIPTRSADAETSPR